LKAFGSIEGAASNPKKTPTTATASSRAQSPKKKISERTEAKPAKSKTEIEITFSLDIGLVFTHNASNTGGAQRRPRALICYVCSQTHWMTSFNFANQPFTSSNADKSLSKSTVISGAARLERTRFI